MLKQVLGKEKGWLVLVKESQQVSDGNFQVSLPGYHGGHGDDEEDTGCTIVGVKDRMAELEWYLNLGPGALLYVCLYSEQKNDHWPGLNCEGDKVEVRKKIQKEDINDE